jgi:GNAT superfamily N-acetyltransferase
MIRLVRTNNNQPDFIELVKLLDAGLAIVDGEQHNFYSQFNSIDNIPFVVVAYDDDTPVGCGAIKEYDAESMEVKRMYVSPGLRNKGIATTILSGLENWARELSYKKCILETGKRQIEAIHLYKKNGYKLIPNYGQYITVENSVCFEKEL